MAEPVTGRRVYGLAPHELQPGDYGHWDEHGWYGHCPGTGDLVANLNGHQVVEHEDGTITVSPSILCSGGPKEASWHGFLERGVWRET